MRLPDLKKLRHVVMVAEAGSITTASRMLAMTQSALTKSVADVEHLLGMKLFERLPRGVRLTEAGRVFVERAGKLLSQADDLLQDLDALNDLRDGHLKIGVAPAAFVIFLENTLSAFARVYPGIRIDVRHGTVDEMARGLIGGQLDLCVGAANFFEVWKEADLRFIVPLKHFFIGREGHPASQIENLSAKQLLRYPVILPAAGLSTEIQLTEAYRAAEMSPRPPHYICDHFPLVEKLVKSTDAISPVVTLARASNRLKQQYCVFEDIVELGEQSLGIVTTSSRQQSPAIEAFTEIFRSFLTDAELTIV